MEGQEGIAQRVADSITQHTLTQAEFAAQIGLTQEELSTSLRGLRAFSSVELVQLAEVLKVDAYWLITGRPDPYRLRFTARHDVDHAPPQAEHVVRHQVPPGNGGVTG
ncbi:hypothetical protein TUM20983_34930 [Mycobacterium antarcticum]|uniref:helix-turn-helix domain-containing protein n=1 Tax=Mycolicibacterium sp. TUM20983 TaxID=3023369 RepID=UPI0023986651|nr:helix-turn-helix domain-containing protein [Mycolicibacterium sp. TUM20983]GLP76383.1 hypothetical protein TUM20983_34930 [Mycolicibacterium sp. TUM20983]